MIFLAFCAVFRGQSSMCLASQALASFFMGFYHSIFTCMLTASRCSLLSTHCGNSYSDFRSFLGCFICSLCDPFCYVFSPSPITTWFIITYHRDLF